MSGSFWFNLAQTHRLWFMVLSQGWVPLLPQSPQQLCPRHTGPVPVAGLRPSPTPAAGMTAAGCLQPHLTSAASPVSSCASVPNCWHVVLSSFTHMDCEIVLKVSLSYFLIKACSDWVQGLVRQIYWPVRVTWDWSLFCPFFSSLCFALISIPLNVTETLPSPPGPLQISRVLLFLLFPPSWLLQSPDWSSPKLYLEFLDSPSLSGWRLLVFVSASVSSAPVLCLCMFLFY